MRVLITGISGSQISDFAEECVAKGNKQKSQSWHHLNFKDLVKKRDPEAGRMTDSDWEDSILKRPAVAHFRDAAWDDLLAEIAQREQGSESATKTTTLISMHLTFRNDKSILSGVHVNRLNELGVDIFVTVVDDIISIWERLRESDQGRWKDLGPIDLLEWREFEIFLTEQLALYAGDKQRSKPFYLLPRNQTPQTLVDIVTHHTRMKFYRSYPITFVASRKEVQAEADRVGTELGKLATVFDPLGIKDLERIDELKDLYEKWCGENKQKPSSLYWSEVVKYLDQQTVTRDHRLINQAEGIVVYYPALDYFEKKTGKLSPITLVPFSSGVLDEMHYATQLGKKVYLIWPKGKNPGPFLPIIYTEKFEDLDSLLEYLKKDGDK